LDTLMAEVEETQAAVTEIEDVFTRTSDLLGDSDAFQAPDQDQKDASRSDRLRI
jgi:hypothetical protein